MANKARISLFRSRFKVLHLFCFYKGTSLVTTATVILRKRFLLNVLSNVDVSKVIM